MKINNAEKKIIIVLFSIWLMVLSAGNLRDNKKYIEYTDKLKPQNNIYNEIMMNNQKTNTNENESNEIGGLLNINMATKEDFMTLNGINETLADNIISYRDLRGGAFLFRDEMKNVPGITDEIYELIKDKITIKL